MKENITISEMTSIKQAMKLLNKTGENCLLVVDENKKCYSLVVDRHILND